MVLTLSFNKGPLHHQKSENSWKYTIDFKHYIWDKVFKSGLSKFFKGCLPQNLLSLFLNSLFHLFFRLAVIIMNDVCY